MYRRIAIFALVHVVFLGLVWIGGALAGSGQAAGRSVDEASWGYAVAPAASPDPPARSPS